MDPSRSKKLQTKSEANRALNRSQKEHGIFSSLSRFNTFNPEVQGPRVQCCIYVVLNKDKSSSKQGKEYPTQS